LKNETYYLFICISTNYDVGQSDFDKAEQLYKANKMDQAELAFESVLKSSPSNLKTIEYLGDIAGHNKSWDKAIGYKKKKTAETF
jgi:predicted Zn-dependent protease